MAVLLGATVMLSSAHRRTKRLILATEAAVVALAITYGILWSFAVH